MQKIIITEIIGLFIVEALLHAVALWTNNYDPILRLTLDYIGFRGFYWYGRYHERKSNGKKWDELL